MRNSGPDLYILRRMTAGSPTLRVIQVRRVLQPGKLPLPISSPGSFLPQRAREVFRVLRGLPCTPTPATHALRLSPLARLKQERALLDFPTRRCAELPLHPQFDHRIEAAGHVDQMTGWPLFLNGYWHSPGRQLNWNRTRGLLLT